MKTLISLLGCLFLFTLQPAFAEQSTTESKDKARAEIRKASDKTLADLYRAKPSARKVVEGAAGYATFSNFGMKIFVAGGGAGKGLAVRGTGSERQETFMKMVEVQAGLGIGIKKFKLVFVFENSAAFDRFVKSGWESSAQATAAATDGSKGAVREGAVPIGDGVWLFQLTDKGLALEATIKGTKYYKDDELN